MTNSTDLPIPCNEFTSAGLFRRMAALVYDLFLLAAIVMAYALVVITPLRMAFYGMPQENGDWLGFPIWLQIVIMFGLSFVLPFLALVTYGVYYRLIKNAFMIVLLELRLW